MHIFWKNVHNFQKCAHFLSKHTTFRTRISKRLEICVMSRGHHFRKHMLAEGTLGELSMTRSLLDAGLPPIWKNSKMCTFPKMCTFLRNVHIFWEMCTFFWLWYVMRWSFYINHTTCRRWRLKHRSIWKQIISFLVTDRCNSQYLLIWILPNIHVLRNVHIFRKCAHFLTRGIRQKCAHFRK